MLEDRCPECDEILQIGQGHRRDPDWKGVFCSSCGYTDPSIPYPKSIRYGVVIKVLQETRSRLKDAKKALGKRTYDDLFNWLLEQAGQ